MGSLDFLVRFGKLSPMPTPALIDWTPAPRSTSDISQITANVDRYRMLLTTSRHSVSYRVAVHEGAREVARFADIETETSAKRIAVECVRADMALRLAAIEASIDADVTAIVEAPVGQTVGGR